MIKMNAKEFDIMLFDNNIQIENLNTKEVIHLNLAKPLETMTLDEIEVACGEHLENAEIARVLRNELVERFVVYDINQFAILHDGSLMGNTERMYNSVTWTLLLDTKACMLVEENEGISRIKEAINKHGIPMIDDMEIEWILKTIRSRYIKFKTTGNLEISMCKLRGLDCNGNWIENSMGAVNIAIFNSDAKHAINYQVSKWCNEATGYMKGLTGYFRNGNVTVQLQLMDMEDKILDVITYERQITSASEISDRIHKILINAQEGAKPKNMDVF